MKMLLCHFAEFNNNQALLQAAEQNGNMNNVNRGELMRTRNG
ncbi:hypothetical protein wVul_1059 [Wolbachia endosymbiont of Armadillidium vulgare str. wVulC]|nr:hypothetical protein wVul_1574 [Wolbachia endosymbiont of Armadillidium vulgare str. wVulC]KLT22399.1 hypothetical protein wVul_1059 [Wolbachia endosymbiont of Armadillidium vulgare str. wVulC]